MYQTSTHFGTVVEKQTEKLPQKTSLTVCGLTFIVSTRSTQENNIIDHESELC